MKLCYLTSSDLQKWQLQPDLMYHTLTPHLIEPKMWVSPVIVRSISYESGLFCLEGRQLKPLALILPSSVWMGSCWTVRAWAELMVKKSCIFIPNGTLATLDYFVGQSGLQTGDAVGLRDEHVFSLNLFLLVGFTWTEAFEWYEDSLEKWLDPFELCTWTPVM